MVQTYRDETRAVRFAVLGAVIVMTLFILLVSSVYTIPAGYRGVLLTWGKANTVAIEEGLHFKIPIAQSIKKMEVRTQKYTADASAASKDLQIVTAQIATNYHLIPSEVPKIYTDLGLNFAERIIQPMEQEVVKATTARFTAEELITKREEVRTHMKDILIARLAERGIIVEEVSIIDFDFSDSFNDAIEQKVTAEQLMLKAEKDLERIQVEAKQAQAQAEGFKLAAIAKAEGDAMAIQLIEQQLKKSPQFVEYLKVQKWDGKLPQATLGMPFIDVTPK